MTRRRRTRTTADKALVFLGGGLSWWALRHLPAAAGDLVYVGVHGYLIWKVRNVPTSWAPPA